MGLYVIAGKAKQSHKTKSFFPAGLPRFFQSLEITWLGLF